LAPPAYDPVGRHAVPAPESLKKRGARVLIAAAVPFFPVAATSWLRRL
jgi:hypothetical protein